jgi:hypothetical protein
MGWHPATIGSHGYRATIFITDPALDARSLNVALLTLAPPLRETTRTPLRTPFCRASVAHRGLIAL